WTAAVPALAPARLVRFLLVGRRCSGRSLGVFHTLRFFLPLTVFTAVSCRPASILSRRSRSRFEPGHHGAGNASLEQLSDACKQRFFLAANEGDGFAFLACAAGAANTVHVILRNL